MDGDSRPILSSSSGLSRTASALEIIDLVHYDQKQDDVQAKQQRKLAAEERRKHREEQTRKRLDELQ
ncbi:hypothetical protein LPJ60_003731, partial [Coemansia sp. RSA 2675]